MYRYFPHVQVPVIWCLRQLPHTTLDSTLPFQSGDSIGTWSSPLTARDFLFFSLSLSPHHPVHDLWQVKIKSVQSSFFFYSKLTCRQSQPPALAEICSLVFAQMTSFLALARGGSPHVTGCACAPWPLCDHHTLPFQHVCYLSRRSERFRESGCCLHAAGGHLCKTRAWLYTHLPVVLVVYYIYTPCSKVQISFHPTYPVFISFLLLLVQYHTLFVKPSF